MGKVDAAPREPVTLLRALSKPGAMELFALASQGISNSTDAMEELVLTKKTYYSRLRGLVDAGLVEGGDGSYRQTALGRIIHRRALHIMERACEGEDLLRLLDEMEAADVGGDFKEVFAKALADRGIVGFIEYEGGLTPVRVIDDFEALVRELVNLCDAAEESILLASSYMDVRVIEAVLRCVRRGVAFRLIVGREGLSQNILRLRAILSPRFAKALIEFMGSPEALGDTIREAKITNSFCIIDGVRSIFELAKPIGKAFWIAFIIEGRDINMGLTNGFEELWKAGKPSVMLRFLRSLKRKASDEDDELEDEVEG